MSVPPTPATLPDLMMEVERLVEAYDLSYLEAVVHYCELYKAEIESIGDQIKKTPLLRARLQLEAEDLNFLKKTARLPI